jgi:hypothetical protein
MVCEAKPYAIIDISAVVSVVVVCICASYSISNIYSP